MFKNLRELITSMPDEKACRDYLVQQRWNGKPICPFCFSDKVYVIENGKRFKCGNSDCYKKFSVTVGTIFEASNIPLTKWLMAIYLCTAHKKGISSYQLGRDLGIAQKNAWFMLHRIRELMRVKQPSKLNNTVEIDEVYIGGKVSKMSKSKRKKLRDEGNTYNTKTMVLGMIERGGNLMLTPLTNTLAAIQSCVVDNIDTKASLITDSNTAYNGIKNVYSSHEVVNHSAHEYVREGGIHTNSIEGAFSLLRRSILGIYHQVTPKHLSRYCDETTFRYNLRKMKDNERFSFALTQSEGRLSYKTLIKATAPIKMKNEYAEAVPNELLNAKIKGRPVHQIFDGEIVATFNSMKEAEAMTGIHRDAIAKVVRGERLTTGGYQWRYA